MAVRMLLERCRVARKAMHPWTGASPYAYRNLVELQWALVDIRARRMK